MRPFTQHTGLVAPMDRSNVDTDQIIPKQFLKRIERTGFGQFLFFDWRYLDDGSPNSDFLLNRPEYQGASILLARRNFGCGSSREHAPWALEDYGFRVVLAPSFADIFYNNCFKNGMLPIRLDEGAIDDLFTRAKQHPGYQLTIDLEACTIRDPYGLTLPFDLDEFRRHSLLNGLDDIGLTLQHEVAITAYEQSQQLAEQATRIIGRLPGEKRAELDRVVAEVENELGHRIQKASPSRIALAKLKVARLREGISLGEIAEMTGIDRGNLSKLENSVENVELNTLARLADALGYDIVVDLCKRPLP